MIKHLEHSRLFNEEIESGTVVVDFYADWCGPCQMLAPNLEQLSNEVDIKILKINVDEIPEIAREFHIMSIPTLLLFKEGKMTKRELGYMPIEKLREFIK